MLVSVYGCSLPNSRSSATLQGIFARLISTASPIARQPKAVREAVFRCITEPKLTPKEVAEVERSTLLLLRGLISGGVLSFTFIFLGLRSCFSVVCKGRAGRKM